MVRINFQIKDVLQLDLTWRKKLHSMEDVISKITKDAYDGKDGLDVFTSDVNLIFS